MKHGAANYLEVLTSQQNLLQAELTESDDRFDEIQSVIHFYKALGGGVE
jgi:outer membrane protein TolC